MNVDKVDKYTNKRAIVTKKQQSILRILWHQERHSDIQADKSGPDHTQEQLLLPSFVLSD